MITLANGDWEVLYFQPGKGLTPRKEIGQVVIERPSGRVLEQWTGIQLNWPLARGIPGFVGGHVNALYIWLPLCLLFMLPFFDFRRPFSLLHLDLLLLLSLSISFAFIIHGHLHASVPLVYPPLLYLLARMLALTRRRSVGVETRPTYIPWFFPLAILALLGRFSAPGDPGAPTAAAPALSSPRPAAA